MWVDFLAGLRLDPLHLFVHTCREKHQEIITPVQLSVRGQSERFFTENIFVMHFWSTFLPSETDINHSISDLQYAWLTLP